MNQLVYIFEPVYKPTLWGGDRIALYKNETLRLRHIGESWEISAVPGSESIGADGPDKGLTLTELCKKYGEELLGHKCVEQYGLIFPLLVKIIDAKNDLSVQVHPDDNLARKRHNSFGKTEMWYIVDSDPEASIAFGFSRQIDFEQLSNLVEQGKLADTLAKYDTRPGDCFLIPAGRVHTIGAGNLIIEIQRNSDITYRIDDFNRRDANGNLRELHLQLAKDAIDYSVKDNFRTPYAGTPGTPAPIVECDYFKTDFLELAAGMGTELRHIDSFRIIVCIEGAVTITDDFGNTTELTQGHSALIAACSKNIRVTAKDSDSKALLCNI